MRKNFSEPEILALIEQKKTAISYAKQLRDDPEYGQRQVMELDTQIAALTLKRDRIATAIVNADRDISRAQRDLTQLRKTLTLVRRSGEVSKLLRLVEKANQLKAEISAK